MFLPIASLDMHKDLNTKAYLEIRLHVLFGKNVEHGAKYPESLQQAARVLFTVHHRHESRHEVVPGGEHLYSSHTGSTTNSLTYCAERQTPETLFTSRNADAVSIKFCVIISLCKPLSGGNRNQNIRESRRKRSSWPFIG